MRIYLLIFTILALFLGIPPVSALSVSISDVPESVTIASFTLNVSISGASPATNYLRVNFFPTGTTHYFGYTYNGTTFVNSSDYSQYLPVTIDSEGNWSGSISAKIDADSSYYSGPGTYSLKVRRYTQSGSSYTWSNELTVNVTAPTPSPSSTPTPTPTPSVAPSPTLKPTSTPTPKKTATPSPSPASTPAPLPTETSEESAVKVTLASKRDYRIASVSGATSSAAPSASPSSAPLIKSQKQANPLILLGTISLLLGGTGVGYIYLRTNGKLHFPFRK